LRRKVLTFRFYVNVFEAQRVSPLPPMVGAH